MYIYPSYIFIRRITLYLYCYATTHVQGKKFLLCDYNRDGDSYRSPWSNTYFPILEDGFVPSEKLREMEIDANELFDAYRELYSEGGTSSAYLWDLETGFAGCFLIKKCTSHTIHLFYCSMLIC